MTQTKAITIQGFEFEILTPYAEGHVVNEAEAKALNQTRLENVRNNAARVVKAATDEEGNLVDEAAVRAQIAEYDANYVFTLASVGGGRKPSDPVEAEALRMARAAITAQLRAAGRKAKDIDKDVLDAAVAKLAGQDNLRKAAAKAVKERAALAEGALDALDLG